jgi:mono/diheme cytochrome c family protein
VRWTARGGLVGLVLVAGAAAGSRDLVAAANAPPGLSPLDVPTESEALGRGEALYLANCASCHGREGDGDGPIRTLPPAGPLGDAVRRTSAAALGYRIATGVAGTPMPAFAGSLTEAERRDLVGYLRATWIDAE